MDEKMEVAGIYVDCGRAIGFFYAEMILMKYLPANKPDGKCYDVPKNKLPAFVRDLKNAAEHGVQLTDGGLRILDGESTPAAIVN